VSDFMNSGIGKKIAIGGLMTSLAIIFTYIETLIPFNFGIPGIKLGLANVVVLFALYNMNAKQALFINVIRVLVVGFMFGNMTSIVFSFSGAVLSLLVMFAVLKLTKRSVIVVSGLGAMGHITGQLLAGLIWYPVQVLLYYSLFLMAVSFLTGIIIGIIVSRISYIYRTKANY